MKKIRIGIDPAFRKSGFAVCIIDEDNSASFKVYKYYEQFILWLFHDRPQNENTIWIVENSNLQKKVWENKTVSKSKKKIITSKNPAYVGKNQAISQSVCRLLELLNCEVYQFSPLQKGKAWTEHLFLSNVNFFKLKLINYNGSEDERVALQLALKNVNILKLMKK